MSARQKKKTRMGKTTVRYAIEITANGDAVGNLPLAAVDEFATVAPRK